MEKKRLLLVRASSDICGAEIDNLKSIAEMNGIIPEFECIDSDDLWTPLGRGHGRFDYIYLGAHANQHYFGGASGEFRHSWIDFAYALCDFDLLNPGCILMLGCCRGGHKSVALKLFCACEQIDYVCGPGWTVRAPDITTGFHVFMYNMETRGEQPSTAADRASKATNYDFFCHDRIEFENDIRSESVNILQCTAEKDEE